VRTEFDGLYLKGSAAVFSSIPGPPGYRASKIGPRECGGPKVLLVGADVKIFHVSDAKWRQEANRVRGESSW